MVKIAESKDYTNYGVLGIVAIVAVVGLVLLFSEKLEFKKESISSGDTESVTGSFTLFSKQDCVSSSTRPCYDKQTGKNIVGLEPKGGEKAFTACLKSKVVGSSGSYMVETPVCDEEKFLYCYEGKSKVFLRKFEGVCGETQTEPQPPIQAQACPNVPQYFPIIILDSRWSMREPTYSGYLFTAMLKSRSGALFATGFRMVIESDGSYGGYAPIMYKSTDNGASWNSVELPYLEGNTYWNLVWAMAEDKNGVLYAGGTSLWKSFDDGNTWKVLPVPITDTYGGGSVPIYNMMVTRDNALVASFTFTATYTYGSLHLPYHFSKVYKSVDGGNTWNELFSHDPTHRLDSYISSVVEANDGSLVFRDYPYEPSVYRYYNGVITKTFSDFIFGTEPNAGLLKAGDGAIYLISVDKSIDINTIDYTLPGAALLAAYKSTDNGITWNKVGVIPNSWSIQGPIVEAADGTMYVTSHSPCYGGDAIFKSTDRGATWSIIAAPPRFGTGKRHDYYSEYYFEYRIRSIVEASGKILNAGTAPVIFSTP